MFVIHLSDLTIQPILASLPLWCILNRYVINESYSNLCVVLMLHERVALREVGRARVEAARGLHARAHAHVAQPHGRAAHAHAAGHRYLTEYITFHSFL